MNRSFESHILDERGKRYVLKVLSKGKTLSLLAHERLASASGVVEAYTPVGWKESEIGGFEYAWPIPKSSATRQRDVILAEGSMDLAGTIAMRLMTPDTGCLAENRLANCDDKFVRFDVEKGEPIVCLDREVYWYILDRKLGSSEAGRILAEATLLGLVAIIGKSTSLELSPGGRISAEAIASFVGTTLAVIVSAYDGDGILIWRPTLANA